MDAAVENALGRRVAECRRIAGLTQEQLAERVKVTPGTVSRLERGVTIPSIPTLAKLAEALGLVSEASQAKTHTQARTVPGLAKLREYARTFTCLFPSEGV